MSRRLTVRWLPAALVLCGLCLVPAAAARAADPPTLGTVWISEVTPQSATANAFVNPHGLATSWRFEYLTDAAYAADLAAGREAFAAATPVPAPGGAAPITAAGIVSWPLGGLTQSTTYHLRAVAESAAGTAVSLEPLLFITGTTLVPCVGDACQPLPSPPEDPTPGTQVPGPGNPPLSFPKATCPKGKHPVRRKGKTRCAPRRRHAHHGHHRRRRPGARHRGGRG